MIEARRVTNIDGDLSVETYYDTTEGEGVLSMHSVLNGKGSKTVLLKSDQAVVAKTLLDVFHDTAVEICRTQAFKDDLSALIEKGRDV